MTSKAREMAALRPSWGLAAGLLAAGAGALVIKGVVRVVTGGDPSLVPWFGLGTTLGLMTMALCILRRDGRAWAPLLATASGAVGAVGSLVAVAYLATGTIPETPGAPWVVGASYGLLSLGGFLALAVLGVVIVRRRVLRGVWRWAPLGVIVAQHTIFLVAMALGEASGHEATADGLGLALSGVAWLVLAYAVMRAPEAPSVSEPDGGHAYAPAS